MPKKLLILVLAAVAALAFTLSGCSTDDADGGETDPTTEGEAPATEGEAPATEGEGEGDYESEGEEGDG